MLGDKTYWFGIATGMLVLYALEKWVLPRMMSSSGG